MSSTIAASRLRAARATPRAPTRAAPSRSSRPAWPPTASPTRCSCSRAATATTTGRCSTRSPRPGKMEGHRRRERRGDRGRAAPSWPMPASWALRFNLTDFDAGGLGQKGVNRLLGAVADMGWFAEVQCAAADFPAAAALLAPTGVRLLIDHLAGVDPALGLDQPGFRSRARRGRTRARGRQALGRVPPLPRSLPARGPRPVRGGVARRFHPPSSASGGRTGRSSTRPRRPDYRHTLRAARRAGSPTRATAGPSCGRRPRRSSGSSREGR